MLASIVSLAPKGFHPVSRLFRDLARRAIAHLAVRLPAQEQQAAALLPQVPGLTGLVLLDSMLLDSTALRGRAAAESAVAHLLPLLTSLRGLR